MNTRGDDRVREFHRRWLESVPPENADAVRTLVSRLFPRTAQHISEGAAIYESDWNEAWRQERRIASPALADTFFRFAPPEGAATQVEVSSILALPSAELARYLVDQVSVARQQGGTRAAQLLEELALAAETLDLPTARNVLRAVLDVGDRLDDPRDRMRELVSWGNDVRISRLVTRLLRGMPPEARYPALAEALADAGSIYTIVRETHSLLEEHSANDRESRTREPLVTEEEAFGVQSLALKKIRRVAEDGSLKSTINLPFVLYRWRDWAAEPEVRRWVARETHTNEALVRFVAAFLTERTSQGMSDRVARRYWYLDPEWLEPFLDIEEARERLKDVPLDSLSREEADAVTQFLGGGKDVD